MSLCFLPFSFYVRILIDFSRHPEPRSSFRRRSSIIDFQPITARRSSLAFRKNEQISFDGTRRMSLLEQKANGDLNKTMKNLVVKVRLIGRRVSHRFLFPV